MEQKDNKKNLNERIYFLLSSLEKKKYLNKEDSLRWFFIRGIFQGLGVIIGSTIIAGIFYSFLINFIDPKILTKWSLEYIIEKEKIDNLEKEKIEKMV